MIIFNIEYILLSFLSSIGCGCSTLYIIWSIYIIGIIIVWSYIIIIIIGISGSGISSKDGISIDDVDDDVMVSIGDDARAGLIGETGGGDDVFTVVDDVDDDLAFNEAGCLLLDRGRPEEDEAVGDGDDADDGGGDDDGSKGG